MKLAISLLPTWLAAAWLVSKAAWFWTHWPDCQFGWVVLILCAYLFWEAWPRRPELRCHWRLATSCLVAPGFAGLFFVQVYQAAFGSTPASVMGLALTLLLVAAANVHYLFGWAGVRHFAMPFGFILISLPLPSFIQGPVILGLQSKVAAINVELLNLFGIPAVRAGNVINLANCAVGIDEACSGIRSLQSTVMATLFIGYVVLRSISTRLALLLAGVGLALVGNVCRSVFLGGVAARNGADAIKHFHDTAGWSILLFTVVGVGLLAWLFARLERMAGATPATGPAPQPPVAPTHSPTSPG